MHSASTFETMEDQNDMQDLYIDDWDGIFDDDSPSGDLQLETEGLEFDGNNTCSSPVDNDASASWANNSYFNGSHNYSNGNSDRNTNANQRGGLPPLPLPLGDALRRSVSEPSSNYNVNNKKRCSVKSIEREGRPLPPPSWHSEAADRPHRQAMIVEIARLLQSRKKTVPSQEWLRQLPYKARKLEERLYRNSTSLEAYLDKATLKTRLKKLARVITNQFEEAKKQRRATATSLSRLRSSSETSSISSSLASFATSAAAEALSHRDSITSVSSIDSLRSLRESLAKRTALSSSAIVADNNLSFLEASSSSSAISDRNNFDYNSRRQSTGLSLDSELQAIPQSHFATPHHRRDSFEGSSNSALQQQQHMAIMSNSGNNNNSSNLAEIDRQRSVNAQLQQQIMENIRQQEELVRRMQQQGQQQQQQHSPVGGGPLPLSMAPTLVRASSYGSVQNQGGAVMGTASGGISLQTLQQQQQQQQARNQFPPPNIVNSLGGGGGPVQTSNLQMHPNIMAAMMSNRLGCNNVTNGGGGGHFQPVVTAANNGPMMPNLNVNDFAAMSNNPLLAAAATNMNNRSMLQRAFLQASQGLATGAQQQQQQHTQQQFAFLQGTPMMPDPSSAAMMAAAAAAGLVPSPAEASSAVTSHQQLRRRSSSSSYNPILPNSIPGPPVSPVSNLAMPPPPSATMVGGEGGVMTQLSLQDAAVRMAKSNGVMDDGEPLSPGSFNW